MVLKSLVTDIKSVPEADRSHYVEVKEGPHAGKFLLGVESSDGFGLEDVTGLKTALSQERTKRGEFENVVKAFEGLDPKEARDALRRIKEGASPDAKQQAEEIAMQRFAQLKGDFEKKVRDLEDALQKTKQENTKFVRTSIGTAALAKAKGNPDLLMPHIERMSRVTIDEKTGQPRIEFLDDQNNVLVSRKQGSTAPMDAEEFVATILRDRFAQAFEGHGNAGSGRSGTSGSDGRGGQRQPYQITNAEAGNPQRYQLAMAEAKKAGRSLPQIIDD